MTRLRNQILVGDALTRLRQVPDACIDSGVTSPPYFRLRNYGHDKQLGLEGHVEEWVDGLRALPREANRVLVPTGTVWLNLGDGYSTHAREGAARKSLLMAPERLALALSEDGWVIRNKIVWAKTNTVLTSVRDRLATKHEVIYLSGRNVTYYVHDAEVREPFQEILEAAEEYRSPSAVLVKMNGAPEGDHSVTAPRGAVSTLSHLVRLRGGKDPHGWNKRLMAVAVGFEPTEELPPHTLSRRAP